MAESNTPLCFDRSCSTRHLEVRSSYRTIINVLTSRRAYVRDMAPAEALRPVRGMMPMRGECHISLSPAKTPD